MRIGAFASLAVLSVSLSACGWHLQGGRNVAVNISPVFIDTSDSHSEFAQALVSRLHGARVELAPTAAAARVTIHVRSESTGHHVSAVSALNEPQQYEVFYSVNWRISGRSDNQTSEKVEAPLRDVPIVDEQASSLSRTMNYEKTAALAMLRQEQLVQRRLAEDLADQVMRRLAILSTAAP